MFQLAQHTRGMCQLRAVCCVMLAQQLPILAGPITEEQPPRQLGLSVTWQEGRPVNPSSDAKLAEDASRHSAATSVSTTTIPFAKMAKSEGAAMASAAAAARRALRTTTTTVTSIRAAVNLVLMPDTAPAKQRAAARSAVMTDLAGTVLIEVATCDTLSCPSGYEPRRDAYRTLCGGKPGLLTCSLDIDLGRCCNKKLAWWTYMMAELAFFCLLSMLCSALAGYHHWRCPNRARRHDATMKEMSKDPEEEEPLESSQRSLAFQAASLPALPASMALPSVSLHGGMKTPYPGLNTALPAPLSSVRLGAGAGYVVR